eukprot:ANDGO_08004.mRNA.1 Putative leucine-rich repeat-containing protein DDB_G0281931
MSRQSCIAGWFWLLLVFAIGASFSVGCLADNRRLGRRGSSVHVDAFGTTGSAGRFPSRSYRSLREPRIDHTDASAADVSRAYRTRKDNGRSASDVFQFAPGASRYDARASSPAKKLHNIHPRDQARAFANVGRLARDASSTHREYMQKLEEKSRSMRSEVTKESEGVSVRAPVSIPVPVGGTLVDDCAVIQEFQTTAFRSFQNMSCAVGTSCCSCPEVTCRGGRVVGLHVVVQSGVLPPSLWNLTALEEIIVIASLYPPNITDSEIVLFNIVYVDMEVTLSLGGTVPCGAIPPNLVRFVLTGSFVDQPTSSSHVLPTVFCPGFLDVLPTQLETFILVSHSEGSIPDRVFDMSWLHYLQVLGFHRGFVEFEKLSQFHNLFAMSIEGAFAQSIPKFRVPRTLRVFDLWGYFTGNVVHYADFPRELFVFSIGGEFLSNTPAPASFWPNLVILQLQGDFRGELPSTFASTLTSNMSFLQLSGQFGGALPSSLLQLSGLVSLGVYGMFQDPIPDFPVQFLGLISLSLTGEFSGSFPVGLSSISSLTSLALSGRFSCELPRYLSAFPSITSLELIGFMDGTIPNEWEAMTSLETLVLEGYMTGNLSIDFSRMRNLSYVVVIGNLVGNVPSFENNLLLNTIILKGFFPSVPTNLTIFSSLSIFIVLGEFNASNSIYIDFPQSLQIFEFCCDGALNMSSFLFLPNLQVIDVSRMTLTGGPMSIGSLTNLEIAFFDGCGLQELSISSPLERLSLLSVASNNLSRLESASHFPNIVALDISNNSLAGPVPYFQSLCSLKATDVLQNVFILEMSLNQFDIFPWSDTCQFPTLIFLNVSSNVISGSIPDTLPTAAPRLKTVDLSANQLEGSIPYAFITFDDLDTVSVARNTGMNFVDDLQGAPGRDGLVVVGGPSDVHLSSQAFATCPNLYLAIPGAVATLFSDDSSTGFSGCECLNGYYGIPPNCMICTDLDQFNARCPGNGAVYAAEGFWATPPLNMAQGVFPEYILPCLDSGSAVSVCHYDPYNVDVCKAGHTGRLCADCDSGYFALSSTSCAQCSNSNAFVGILVFLTISVIIFMSTFGLFRLIRVRGPPISKVFFEFIQILYFVYVPLPSSLQFAGSAAGILNLRAVGAPCIFSNWSYTASYFTVLLVYPAFLVILFVGYLMCLCSIRVFRSPEFKQRFYYHSIWLFFFCYVGIVAIIFEPLSCEEDPGLHEKYIRFSPAVRCHLGLQALSAVLLPFVIVFIPFGVFWIVRKAHLNPTFYASGSYYSMVYFYCTQHYNPPYWWWDIWTLLRRSLIIMLIIDVPPESSVRGFFLGLIMLTSLVAHIIYRPFRSRTLNRTQIALWIVLIMNYVVSIQYRVVGTNDLPVISWMFVFINSSMLAFALYLAVRALWRWFRGDVALSGDAVYSAGRNRSLEMHLLEKH